MQSNQGDVSVTEQIDRLRAQDGIISILFDYILYGESSEGSILFSLTLILSLDLSDEHFLEKLRRFIFNHCILSPDLFAKSSFLETLCHLFLFSYTGFEAERVQLLARLFADDAHRFLRLNFTACLIQSNKAMSALEFLLPVLMDALFKQPPHDVARAAASPFSVALNHFRVAENIAVPRDDLSSGW
jgi:hypothetical protein